MKCVANSDGGKVYSVQPLDEWILDVEDQYIIETISEISSKSKWDCNEATYILHNACLKEWKTRHGSRSVPKIVSEIEMILTDDRDYSIML